MYPDRDVYPAFYLIDHIYIVIVVICSVIRFVVPAQTHNASQNSKLMSQIFREQKKQVAHTQSDLITELLVQQ